MIDELINKILATEKIPWQFKYQITEFQEGYSLFKQKLLPIQELYPRLELYSVQPMGLKRWGFEIGQNITQHLMEKITGSNEFSFQNFVEATETAGLYLTTAVQVKPPRPQVLTSLKDAPKKVFNLIQLYKS